MTLTACAYFTAGYLFRSIKPRIPAPWAIVMVIAPIIIHDRWGATDLHSLTGLDFPIYFILSSVCSLGVIRLCDSVSGRAATLLDYIGSNTLIILTLHFLSFKLVSLLKCHVYGLPYTKISEFPFIHEYNDLFWILYVIVGVAVPLGYASINRRLSRRLPILSRI